jgi:TonB-linked SusC/RagA family outer membrane protein
LKKSLLLLLALIFGISHVHAQQKTVTGTVTTQEDGSPLPGVNIILKGTGTGTVTDIEGKYALSVSSDAILVYSFIGYESQEVAVGNSSVIDIILVQEDSQLEEVVITGYSTQQKRDVTGSIASLGPEQFETIPITGVDQALQGQAPGVMVTQSSGTPGGGIMVRVRGNASISGSNAPLYIVDGVPVAAGGISGRSFGGQGDNALAMFNPSDIASIEVLKDASAKAIYGARAANGVVLITTKRGGAASRTRFNVNVQRGVSDITRRLDLLNSQELLSLQREAIENADGNPDQAGIPGITDAVDTDWLDAVLRQGILQEYQVSAQGGGEKTQFYISGGYRDEEGVQWNSRFQRMSATANIDHKATEKIKLGLNLMLSRTTNNRVKNDNFLDGVYSGALKSLPYYQPYNEDGELYAPGEIGYAGFPNFNPLAQAVEPRFETYASRLTGGIYVEYTILPKLRFRSQASVDFISTVEDQFEPTTTAIGGFLESVGQQGYGIYSNSESARIVNSNVFTYNTTLFGGEHDLSVLLGNEITDATGRGGSVVGILFPSDNFTYLSSAGLYIDGSSSLSESGLVSFFSSANYGFRDKYLLSLTLRTDGSSRFGEDRRFGFFPAASLGWRISDEPFMQNLEIIDDLKLRGSFGVTGNQSIPNFLFLGTWGAATAYNFIPAVGPATLANPLLQWEQTTEFNVGFDLSLYAGRFQIGFDAYNNTTNKLLLSEVLPLTTGFGSVQGNLGELFNRGVELSVTSVNMNTPVRWETNFNVSHNSNEVVRLASEEPQFSGYNTFTNSTHIITPGYPLGTYWGLRYLGVDPATGNAIYEDYDNDGRITGDDGQVIGTAQPDIFGGLTNTFSYKTFELSIFFQYSLGNEMINFTNQSLLNSGESLDDNQVRQALDRWQNEGDITDVPRYEQGNTFNNRFSSRFVEDASYVRLKNLSLSYSLPKQIVDKLMMDNFKVFVAGTNLLTFTNYTGADPEVNSIDGSTVSQGLDFFTFPQVRTLSLGLNASF